MVQKKAAGFTMIEILITLIIVGIIMGMAGIGIFGWLPKYYLKSAARDVKSNLLLCRMRAVKDNCNCEVQFNTGGGNVLYTVKNNPSPCPGGTDYNEVTVSSSYKSYISIGNAGQGKDTANDKSTEDAADGVTFTGNKMIFQANGRPPTGFVQSAVYLQNTKGDAYCISVNIAGAVRISRWEKSGWVTQ